MRACMVTRRLAEFLSEPDQQPLGPTDVAESIRILVLDHFADQLRAPRAKSFQRVVDVVDGEHDAQVAKRIHRGVSVILDDGRREIATELEPAMAIRRSHHRDLDVLIAEPGHTPGPFAFDRGASFELQTELAKE